jgi:formylglycine-generating enzyme required for sulfatase activity
MKKLLFIVFFMAAFAITKANNIQITNVSVVPANSTIKFDVSWDNGWRSSVLNNRDAAWVFFKYKNAAGNWTHLNLTNVGNIIQSGYTIDLRNPFAPFIGAFLHRSVSGSGTTTLTNVELGISAAQASGIYDIKAFALEMVYIPQGNFFAGDGISTNSFPPVELSGTISLPNLITDPVTSTEIGVQNMANGAGYGFYCMKYELSQGGYRDFLNTLNYTQQIPHIVPLPNAVAGTYALYNAFRNNIKIKTAGIASTTPAVFGCDADNDGIYDETTDGEYIACNYLNWVDHAAYLDWAGLRAMSELEFEKMCRGPLIPVAGEYAWGNNQISNTIYSLSNPNQASEVVSNSSATLGNANYNSTYPNSPYNGPLRNGVFATATSNRITSGGSFYGVMDLSGNLWERVVRIAYYNVQCGFLGDGNLTADGFSNASNGPGTGTYFTDPVNGLNNANTLIYKGGYFNSIPDRLRISDRGGLWVTDANTVRANDVGIRGVN